MIKPLIIRTFTLLLALGTAHHAAALAPIDDKTRSLYQSSARIVAESLPRVHLSRMPFDDTIASNALERLIASFDYDHTVFMRSDIDLFRGRAATLDDRVADGQLAFARSVYDLFMDRLSNRIDYVEQLLDTGFDFERDETYRWKRKDAEWPNGLEAWDEIWRKKVKNQVLARRIQDDLAAEDDAAKEKDAEASDDEPPNPEASLTIEERVLRDYRQRYTVLQDNDAHWLYTLYLNSFARAYDPHSDFMSKHNTEDFDISMKLSLVGIGALLSSDDGAAKVERLIPGGPAEQDGRLQAGDKIIAVGQGDEEPVDILHWPLSKSVRLIRGEKDTQVVLVVIPASDPSGATTKKIDIIRDEVKLDERAAKGKIKPIPAGTNAQYQIGMITIPDFYGDILGRSRGDKDARSLTADVERIIEETFSNRVDGIIVDLRNNGGGALNEAIDLTGLFIESGPVVQVKSRRGIRIMSDSDPSVLYRGPLVVLVNKLSASASEIFAGALKDYGRAVVIGDSKTHGKGTVQALLQLRSGSPELGSLKLTTAGFYRVNGDSTQLRGIAPHIHITSLLEYMDIGEETLPHALPWDEIRAAYYREYDEWTVHLPELRERSASRRNEDERFSNYRKLLAYLGERQQELDISLQYDKRLQMARNQQAMDELIKQAEVPDMPLDDDAQDVILDEALRILGDLITLHRQDRPAADDHETSL